MTCVGLTDLSLSLSEDIVSESHRGNIVRALAQSASSTVRYWVYPYWVLARRVVSSQFTVFSYLFDLLSTLFFEITLSWLWFTSLLIEGLIIYFGYLLMFLVYILLCYRRFKWYAYIHVLLTLYAGKSFKSCRTKLSPYFQQDLGLQLMSVVCS